jgi:hypothetical protein
MAATRAMADLDGDGFAIKVGKRLRCSRNGKEDGREGQAGAGGAE